MTVPRRSGLATAAALQSRKWTAKSVSLRVTDDGLVRASAPCGESRTLDPEEAETLAARLVDVAAKARTAREAHERKTREEKEVIFPDVRALVVN